MRNKMKIAKENWNRINKLMEVRQKEFLEVYEHDWYHYLIEDEMYKMLCQKLVEIKMSIMPTYILNRKITEDEIKKLASGFITVDDYMKDINIIDLDMNLDKNNDKTKQTKYRLGKRV